MKLSIIVCTYNRSYAMPDCLNSISAALSHAAPIEAEIVVVDNASTDNTTAVVKDWAQSCPFPVVVLHEKKKGLASARNCGLRGAKGDIIFFTDDDCRLTKTFVTELLAYDAKDKEPVIRGGRIELGDPSDLPLTIKTDDNPGRWHPDTPSTKYELMGGKAISGCNMAMRREVVERVGMFDEHLGAGSTIPGGEDLDYYIRAYLLGIGTEYVPDMAIYHFHGRKTKEDGNKLMTGYLIGIGALYAKYIFKDHAFCHEFYWDFKKAIREIITGKNNFLPEWNFSYTDKVICCLRGAGRYVWAVALRK